MPKIRVITTPPGFARKAIREAWVGTEIPIVSGEEAAVAERTFDSSGANVGGYIVRGIDAVQALLDLNLQEAATHWSSPQPPRYLRFAKECCEEI